jgi:preprotein translocase subunit SecF
VLLTLLALYLFGGESIRLFVLALLIGIASGTYSSIFNASPLLVTWHNHKLKKLEKQRLVVKKA